MAARKCYVIFCENRGGYWNRVTKKIKGLEHATEYEGGTKENIEEIIMSDEDLLNKVGYTFSVKTIIRIE